MLTAKLLKQGYYIQINRKACYQTLVWVSEQIQFVTQVSVRIPETSFVQHSTNKSS